MPHVSKTLNWTRLVAALALAMIFLIAAATIAQLRAAEVARFDEGKFFKLYSLMDKFYRKYNGCPEKGYPPEISCQPGAGQFDANLWKQIADQSCRVGGRSCSSER
jgi:hypothetical protein